MVCTGCGIGKTRQKSMNEDSVSWTNKIGERMFMDISSIKHESAGGTKSWDIFIDDYSGFLINRFIKKKSNLAKLGTTLFRRLKTESKITMSNIGCDNTGENKKMEEMCIDQGLGSSLSILQLAHLNRMGGLRGSLPPCCMEGSDQ